MLVYTGFCAFMDYKRFFTFARKVADYDIISHGHISGKQVLFISDSARTFKFGLSCNIPERDCVCIINEPKTFVVDLNRLEQVMLYEMLISDDMKLWELKNPRIASITDIYIPNKILNHYYVTLMPKPIPKRKNISLSCYANTDVVTFVDKEMNNAPIILPFWCVQKYCPKYAHVERTNTNSSLYHTPTCRDLRMVVINIPVDDELANIVMNVFEYNEFPNIISEKYLKRYQEVYSFLVD